MNQLVSYQYTKPINHISPTEPTSSQSDSTQQTYPACDKNALATLLDCASFTAKRNEDWCKNRIIGAHFEALCTPEVADWLLEQTGLRYFPPVPQPDGMPAPLTTLFYGAGTQLDGPEKAKLLEALQKLEQNCPHVKEEEPVAQPVVLPDWKASVARLKEFRRLGENRVYLEVDVPRLEETTLDLAERKWTPDALHAGASLHLICKQLLTHYGKQQALMKAQNIGDQNVAMRDSILSLCNLAQALEKADTLLIGLAEYKATGDQEVLPAGAETAIRELQRAWAELQFAPLWRAVDIPINIAAFDKSLHKLLDDTFNSLEAGCSLTVKAIQAERPHYLRATRTEQQWLQQEADDVIKACQFSSNPLVSQSAAALNSLCQKMSVALSEAGACKDDVILAMRQSSGDLCDLSAALQNADAIQPLVEKGQTAGEEKEVRALAEKALNTVSNALNKALKKLTEHQKKLAGAQVPGLKKGEFSDAFHKLSSEIKLLTEQMEVNRQAVKEPLPKGMDDFLLRSLDHSRLARKLGNTDDKTADSLSALWRLGVKGCQGVRKACAHYSTEAMQSDFNQLIRGAITGPMSVMYRVCNATEDLSTAAVEAAAKNPEVKRLATDKNRPLIEDAPAKTMKGYREEKMAALKLKQENSSAEMEKLGMSLDRLKRDLDRMLDAFPKDAQQKNIHELRGCCARAVKTFQKAQTRASGVLDELVQPGGKAGEKLTGAALRDKADYKNAQRVVQQALAEMRGAMNVVAMATTKITGKCFDLFSNDARIIRPMAESLFAFEAMMPADATADERADRRALVNVVARKMGRCFAKPTDPQGKDFARRVLAEVDRQRENMHVVPKTAEEVMKFFLSWEQQLVEKSPSKMVSGLAYEAAKAMFSATLPSMFGDVMVHTAKAIKTVVKLAIITAQYYDQKKNLENSVKPGQCVRQIHKDALNDWLLKSALTEIISALVPMPEGVSVGAKTVAQVALTGVKMKRDGIMPTFKKIGEEFKTELPSAMLLQGVAAGAKEVVLDVYEWNLARLQKQALADLAQGDTRTAGQKQPRSVAETEAMQGDAAVADASSPRKLRGKRGVTTETGTKVSAEDKIAAVNTRSRGSFSVNTKVEVYQGHPTYDTITVDLKTALENKDNKFLNIRYPTGTLTSVQNEFDSYSKRNFHRDKITFIARQMTPEQWVAYMNFKHNGANISQSRLVYVKTDGTEGTGELQDVLNNTNGDVSKIIRSDDYLAKRVVDDLDFYVQANKTLPLEDRITQDRLNFDRTLAYYNMTNGDPKKLPELIQSGELSASSWDAWNTIQDTKNELNRAIADKTSFTEVRQAHRDMFYKQYEQIDPGKGYEYNQTIQNKIDLIKNEYDIYTALEQDTNEAINALKSQRITFSEEPLERMRQSLIVAYKMKYPEGAEGFRDKEIYQDALRILANKDADPEKAQDLANAHMLINYIGYHRPEWTGNRHIKLDANDFYKNLSDVSVKMSAEDVFDTFSQTLSSPASPYKGLNELQPISEYWNKTDSEYYADIDDYKNNHAKNEATDDIHYLELSSGVYPSDVLTPPVAVKTFQVEVPVTEVRFSESKTLKGDFNHYETEKGTVSLYQTRSGDYWALTTVGNNKKLTKINADIFSRYENLSSFDNEEQVKRFFRDTGVDEDLLPRPETTTAYATLASGADSVLLAPYRLGQAIAGRDISKPVIKVHVDQRYFKVKETGPVRTNSNKSMRQLMIDEATETNKQVAEEKKNFSSFDRRTKPADWDSLSLQKRFYRALSITWGQAKDFNLAVFKPLEIYVRWLEDAGYKPTDEDIAEAYVDLGIAIATLGYGSTVKSIKGIKKALQLVREAREMGLKGKAFKLHMFKGMAPIMQGAAKGMVKAPLREAFPLYDFSDMALSLAKKPSRPANLNLVPESDVARINGQASATPVVNTPGTISSRGLHDTFQVGVTKDQGVTINHYVDSPAARRSYVDDAQQFYTQTNQNGAEIRLTTHETNGAIIHNEITDADYRIRTSGASPKGKIIVLTGTHGSPNGVRNDTFTERGFYRSDVRANALNSNVQIIDISGKTDEEIAAIIKGAQKGDTVIGAFCHSRNDKAITKALGIPPLESHVTPDGSEWLRNIQRKTPSSLRELSPATSRLPVPSTKVMAGQEYLSKPNESLMDIMMEYNSQHPKNKTSINALRKLNPHLADKKTVPDNVVLPVGTKVNIPEVSTKKKGILW
ncbi:MAG: hypothetical protein PW844_08315 [Pantoea sp.]|uniref:hypothetical protein n=1 Tax=Pantoea sp. TaxID=69393 RepID=UPI0023870492|nr:hypothetical protein [Pantoea sp.]MDE1186468.1 hypothetical protein [Pantoea sp.]